MGWGNPDKYDAVLGKWDQDPNEFWEASESQFAPNHTFFVKKYCLRNLTNLTQKNNDHVAEPEEAAGFVEVVHTDDLETASYWVTQNVLELQPTPVLGFDIEWRPNLSKTKQNKTALMQLAAPKSILLLSLVNLKDRRIPQECQVRQILENAAIIKAGVGLLEDTLKFQQDTGVSLRGWVDVSEVERCVAAQVTCTDDLQPPFPDKKGIQKLVWSELRIDVSKPKQVQRSNWENRTLSQDQIRYAALDAWAGRAVFLALQKRLLGKDGARYTPLFESRKNSPKQELAASKKVTKLRRKRTKRKKKARARLAKQAAAAVLSTAAEELRATITVAAQNLDMALAQGSVVFALSLLFPKPRAIAAVHSLPATSTIFGLFEDTSSDDDYYW